MEKWIDDEIYIQYKSQDEKEVTSSAQSLAELAANLQKEINRFKLASS